MIQHIDPARAFVPRPGNGNPGIVPPWLQKPPVITLPVEPEQTRVVTVRPAPRTRIVVGEFGVSVTEVLS